MGNRHRIRFYNDRKGVKTPLSSSFSNLATITLELEGGRSFDIDLTCPIKHDNQLLVDITPPLGHVMYLGGDRIRSIQLIIAPETS